MKIRFYHARHCSSPEVPRDGSWFATNTMGDGMTVAARSLGKLVKKKQLRAVLARVQSDLKEYEQRSIPIRRHLSQLA